MSDSEDRVGTMALDADLIERVRKGELEAFEALYNKYRREVFQTALAITRDRQAAEEILQDCFVRAYKHIDRLDGSGSIAPWLHRVTVNLCYTWISRRRPFALPIEEMLDRITAPSRVSPEHQTERHQFQEAVREAIDSLGSKHRAVIVLHYLHGFSLAEIAYILDCPVGTVKSRLHYACKKLKGELAEHQRLPAGVAYEFP